MSGADAVTSAATADEPEVRKLAPQTKCADSEPEAHMMPSQNWLNVAVVSVAGRLIVAVAAVFAPGLLWLAT